MSNGLLKTIRFNMDDEVDRKLYDWLARLPRGEFSSYTKIFWEQQMKHEVSKPDRTRLINLEGLK